MDLSKESVAQSRSQKILVMKFCIFIPPPQREELGGFWVANFLSYFSRKNGLKFVTPQTSENFTTFSTARKEMYHLELALGATSRMKVELSFGKGMQRLTKFIREFSATVSATLGCPREAKKRKKLPKVHANFWRKPYWKGGKDPHPQDFSLTKKTARFTKGQFRPY